MIGRRFATYFQLVCTLRVRYRELWVSQVAQLPTGPMNDAYLPPVLVMTSTFSGFIQAQILPTRMTSDLLGGMWALLERAKAAEAE
jgi:hypothetical protein